MMAVDGTAEKFGLPGVYKLNCSGCYKFYIGQTGCSFKQRYEHIKALHSTTKFTFANLLVEADHTYTNINNMKILHVYTIG